MGRKVEAAASRPNSPGLSLASLHDAARKGDSCSLQKLLALIDPKAAEKVSAVLLERTTREFSTGRASASVGPCHDKGPEKTCTPRIAVEQGIRGRGKKTTASPLKRLLQKQDAKRRTALYVACSAGNEDVVDALLAVSASPKGHGAWQSTSLHIAAYEGHIAAVRTLLGAGADPWALNRRDQTPSDVSCMYNANTEILKLLDEAVNIRRVISTGAEGLAGATFVHDDGQVGTLADVIERWSFTLEVKLGKNSEVKVYLPVRGQRKLSSTRSSLDTLAGSISLTNASTGETPPRRCEPSIPWSAKAIGRMRLESDDLFRVTTGSLVGATARTPLGSGVVVAARNVSIRCEFETETRNDDGTAISARNVTNADFEGGGVNDGSDTGGRQLSQSAKEIQAHHHPSRNTEHDKDSRRSQGDISIDEVNGKTAEHGHHSDDWDCCSIGAEGAACFDGNVTASTNERTRGDWSDLDCTPRQGFASCTRRHSFLDSLVPLVALEPILDCLELPPSATTSVARARRRRLLDKRNSRTPRQPATASSNTSYHMQQRASAPQYGTGSCNPKPEVDDLFYLGLGHDAFLARSREESGCNGNNVPVKMVGLEEQIEREEGSEERIEEKRRRIQATRSAVHEALLLWSSKASLLQARLTVLRTVSSSSPSTWTFLGSNTSAAENTNNASTMSLDEFLASPSPRCCACDKRGGYQKASMVRPSDKPSARDSIPSQDAQGRGQSPPDDRGSSPSLQPTNDSGGKSSTCGDFRDDPKQKNCGFHDSAKDTAEREELLLAHLQECLKQMTHLRNWLCLLDNNIR